MTTVKQTYAGRNVEHFVVASEKQSPVTVRIGKDGVYACLTCLVIDCSHVRTVEAFVTPKESAA